MFISRENSASANGRSKETFVTRGLEPKTIGEVHRSKARFLDFLKHDSRNYQQSAAENFLGAIDQVTRSVSEGVRNRIDAMPFSSGSFAVLESPKSRQGRKKIANRFNGGTTFS
jgi:hypothetical protein